jgi:choline dehydrogenase
MLGDRCNWPRGKVLGGSSVLNAMVYVRGNRHDYDHWAELGNEGWSYKEILPYFLKSEDNRNPYLAKTPYHSTGGYLTVQESPWRTPLALAFLQAGVELGYENRDCNGEIQTGFMITQGTIRRGSRCSTAKAFLRPVRLRRNLHIAMHSHVKKILMDSSGTNGRPRATAVEFMRYGNSHTVRARREVILSAGAIASPQLLMLSGIGPKEHLRQFNIPVIQDLNVGNNLQDHVGLGGLTFVVDEPVTFKKSRYQTLPVALEYIINERGPLTNLGVEGVAFVNTKYANTSIDWPDVQFHFAPSSINSDGGEQVRRILGLRDRVYNTVYKPLVKAETWTILPLLLRPRSRGWVRLRSANYLHQPELIPNYFAYPEDVAVLIEGIKIAINVSSTLAFQKFGSRLHTIPMPGCGSYTFNSDEYWECALRHFTFTIYHPSGTCKMGPDTDPDAVLDPRLRVRGVDGLRVIDASIMPTIINGNPNAPVIMIAEKGADIIKQDWKVM